MKKILIGLFLVASLSVLGAKSQKKTASTSNYKTNVNNQYFAVDGNLMNMYSKEKTEFKNKYIALSEKNDKKNLIALLKEYVKKYPNDAYAYEEIGTDYDILGNQKEAEKYYLKAIELGDNDTGVYSLFLLYSDEDSLKSLNLTAKEKNEKKNIVDKYEKQLTDAGFTHEKLKELREHKQMALVGNAYSIYRLAIRYYGTKNYKMAEKYAKDFLEFDNENPEILNMLKNVSK
ncbi:tetratricopeptide repeat protein [Leptotrichia sp. HSP-342]|uniref:Tetratricopeptide repeat protein n=1 Tax=Leptotrichia mesophila TaxID=3239303 RepID=A0AB39VBQ1_9FUSO